MSMQPRPWPEVPELTPDVARSSSRRGIWRCRSEELGEVDADGRFVAAFGVRAGRGSPRGQLTIARVLQSAGIMTARQAADAVRDRTRRLLIVLGTSPRLGCKPSPAPR
jgi:hypothetical protein